MGFRMPAEWEPHEGTWLSWPHNPRTWVGNFGPIPSVFVEIAAGAAWSFANEEIAAPVRAATHSVVYRPFTDPPIPAWLALVWLAPATPRVERLVEMARALGLDVTAERRLRREVHDAHSAHTDAPHDAISRGDQCPDDGRRVVCHVGPVRRAER